MKPDMPFEAFRYMFKDIFSLLGEVLVGFVFILEILFLYIKPPLEITPEFLTNFLTLKISFASTIVILIASFLTGYLSILIYQSIESILIFLNKQPSLGKLLNPIVNYLFPPIPLSPGNKRLTPEYKQKILNRIGKYFDLPSLIGTEIYSLSREFCTKHKDLFKTHLIMLRQNLTQGLFVNFGVLFLFAIFSKTWELALLSLGAIVALLIEIHASRIRQREAILDATYLAILLEEKKEKIKNRSN